MSNFKIQAYHTDGPRQHAPKPRKDWHILMQLNVDVGYRQTERQMSCEMRV